MAATVAFYCRVSGFALHTQSEIARLNLGYCRDLQCESTLELPGVTRLTHFAVESSLPTGRWHQRLNSPKGRPLALLSASGLLICSPQLPEIYHAGALPV